MSFFHAKSSRTFATYLRESVTNFSKTAENQKTAFFFDKGGWAWERGEFQEFLEEKRQQGRIFAPYMWVISSIIKRSSLHSTPLWKKYFS